ncbi:MAG: ABC transporter permease [Candidatus Omnitrophica bacterium]|nr:ABC transporter permease [Candidatus Omnitrophota bacterium]
MFERIIAILIKEFKQIFRDPRMKTTIFLGPVIQLLIFGYAATTDITYIPTAIYDLDNTRESRDLTREFTYSKYFVVQNNITTDQEQRDLIDKAKVNVVLRFNRGFARDLNFGKGAIVQMIVDGSDSNTAGVILSYANTIIQRYSYKVLKNEAATYLKQAEFPSVDLRDRAWFNDNLVSRNYYLPGVIAMIVTIMTLLLSSMAIVREKEIGTMEQLIVSPIRPFELILGKLAPFAVIALVQVIMITTVGVLWFHVPIRGSLIFLFISTLIYLLTSLGFGLLISTVSATQQEAMMSVFLFYFPALLLSGFAYPIANMPEIIQYITVLNPLRYFLVILRGIFLKGAGIEILWPQLAALLVMGICVLTISSMRFQKRLG